MKSRIFRCVDNNDVEGLRTLMNYPNFFQIEDGRGHTILKRAIWKRRFAVFNFLLSLDSCPINTRNKKGETTLQFALEKGDEQYCYNLIQKGIDIDNSNYVKLLHRALYKNYFEVAKLLIQKGANVNRYDGFGDTSLHIAFNNVRGGRNELVAMMLYFGANPSIPNRDGCKPIDLGFRNGYLSESMQEHLFFYFFDDYCKDYEMPFKNFFDLLKSDSPLAPQVVKRVTFVILDAFRDCDCFDEYFLTLFRIKLEYLKLLIEEFDYVIQNIIDVALGCDFIDCSISVNMSVENIDFLLRSEFGSDAIRIINKIKICKFIPESVQFDVQSNLIFEFIMIMLSYGAEIWDEDVEKIYETFGDCEFFRILLRMDIKMKNRKRDVMPGLLYDVHMNIETFLSEPNKYGCNLKAIEELLNYFAHPKLKDFCYYYLTMENEDVHAKIKDLPSMPRLEELARNKLRTILIEKYKIANSFQFYTLIKRLPISKVHQKIIALETKLYQNYQELSIPPKISSDGI